MPGTIEVVQPCEALVAAYIDAGLALVPIPYGLKKPVTDNWQLSENAVYTLDDAAERLSGNIGLAHAYSNPPTCAIDFDDLTKARPWLAERGIDVDALLADPEAVRIDSGREGRAKLLYRLPEPLATLQPAKSGLELRCAAANGNTVQDVLPPSIHPDTGMPYVLLGDPARIPPIPDALLALWRRLEGAKPRGKRLELVKSEDQILRTLSDLGMVRSDQGGGAYWIECPFADQHTNFTGDGETIYYLPNTMGFAQAHFHCFHAHCAERKDHEFMFALLERYKKQTGKPAVWGVRVDTTDPPEEPKAETELAWLLSNAPATIKAYVEWHMQNAFRPHPIFALASALLFVEAFIGRSVRLPRDLRVNLWMLVFAPTESGKGSVIDLAEEALRQLNSKKILPAVPHFTNRFGSYQGMLWKLAANPQVIWTNAEMVKTLLDIMAAKEGTTQHAMGAVLLDLHDAATRSYMAPIDYSGHDSRAKKMDPLVYPFFSAVGLGVTSSIGKFNAAAADDGQLNRFFMLVVDDLPPMGSCQPITPLAAEVVKWAQGIQAKKFVEFFNPDVPPAQTPREAKVLEVYPAFDDDWKREGEYGAQLAQGAPGVWGRYAEKILQVCMLYAVADSMKVTPEGFEWAKRLTHWAVCKFGQHFDDQGGGADDVVGKVRNAFLAFFEKPAAIRHYEKHGHLSSGFIAQHCWPWKDNPRERGVVVRALIEEGLIEEVTLTPSGVGYRRLQA